MIWMPVDVLSHPHFFPLSTKWHRVICIFSTQVKISEIWNAGLKNSLKLCCKFLLKRLDEKKKYAGIKFL